MHTQFNGSADGAHTAGGTDQETDRTDSLVRLMGSGRRALDVGARSGHLSLRIAGGFDEVVALDLVKPTVTHPKVTPVVGDAADLRFADDSFDTVLCAEMLEHVPRPGLERVCAELTRVSAQRLVVGVPYKQDIRCGRTTCFTCGKPNPQWGHVNSFDEVALKRLFPNLEWETVEYIGTGESGTNPLSSFLLDLAGNPWGTYGQTEACIHCKSPLLPARRPSVAQRVAAKVAVKLQMLQRPFLAPHANWIHVVMTKHRKASAPVG